MKLLTATSRPWIAWSVVNATYRLSGATFNTPATFPFFANVWHPDMSRSAFLASLLTTPAFWFWSAVAWSLSVATLQLAHHALFKSSRAPLAAALAVTVAMGALLPAVFACLPLGAKDPLANEGSLLAPWFKSGGTMLYAMPRVKSTAHFLRNFETIQPMLRISVHGASHPPAATLSLYWLGRLAGARERVDTDRLRYAAALTAFNALAVLAMFVLGRALFADARTGLLAALLWAVKPAAIAHNTFAQDGVYTICFVLALWLAWKAVTEPKTSMATLCGLGLVLYALTMLTFSWCIFAAGFAIFLAVQSRAERRPLRDVFVRFTVPFSLMTVLLAGTCVAFGFNYFGIYAEAAAYVKEWYDFHTAFLWLLALAGGQVEWLILMGAVVCSVFVGGVLPRWWKERHSPQARYGLILLGVYLLPLVFGPDPLKMETARCWSWMTAVPIAAVAHDLLHAPQAPRTWIAATLALSLFQSYVMRIAMCFLS
ncbi:MAG: hypothetical protein V1929_11960 [bacterium]